MFDGKHLKPIADEQENLPIRQNNWGNGLQAVSLQAAKPGEKTGVAFVKTLQPVAAAFLTFVLIKLLFQPPCVSAESG